jgi:arsenite methyltransferase
MSDQLTTTHSPDEVRDAVRARYAAAARSSMAAADDAGCGCGSGCCGTAQVADPISADLYDPTDVPSEGALAASLGCGNPTALAELHAGEDVLDLGSGGGLDVLLSARRVAPHGTAFGVDMTPEMLELAERNKAEAGIDNAQFLLGSIEDLPLPEAAVDVVISNCVVNLSTDKDAVLREAFRVLRPGGRFAVSDIVLLHPLPDELMGLVALWTGCISGALVDADYVQRLTAAGFADASVEVTRTYRRDELEDLAAELTTGDLPSGLDVTAAVDALDGAFASAFIRAVKPV